MSRTQAAPKWTAIIAGVLGLWVLFSPFIFNNATALLNDYPTFFWTTITAGLLIAILAGYTAFNRAIHA
jgi:uncharacterized integral membrane protein